MLLVTLVAHVLCGLTLGLLVQFFLGDKDKCGIYDGLLGRRLPPARVGGVRR